MRMVAGTRSDLKRRLPRLKSCGLGPYQLVFLVLDLKNLARLRARDPAVGSDQVAVVLHGFGPVVHQMLVDVVGIEQRSRLEGGQQILGERLDQLLGVAVLGEAFERWRDGVLPVREERVRRVLEGGELGMAEDGGLHLGDR